MDILELIDKLKEAIAAFKQAGLHISSLRILVEAVVRAVEQFNADNFKGKDKREAALDLLDRIYEISEIDIPILPNKLERAIIRWIGGVLIDQVVKMLNKTKGW